MNAQSLLIDAVSPYTGATPLSDRTMEQRKSLADLSTDERRALRDAFWQLQHTPATADEQVSLYDQYVALQQAARQVLVMDTLASHGPPVAAGIGPHHIGFLPWHREFLRRFERALQQMVPGVQLPYWDWTCDDRLIHAIVEDFDFSPPLSEADSVVTTPDHNSLPKPALFLFTSASPPDPQLAELTTLHVEVPNIHHFYFFWTRLVYGLELGQREAFSTAEATQYLTGGSPSGNLTPHEPLYWFHLAQFDHLWALWQDNGHQGVLHYPHNTHYPWGAPIPPGHKLNDRMWPWIGDASGYYPDVPAEMLDCLPDYTHEPPRTIKDTLSTRDMGPLGAYEYAPPGNRVARG